jgi:hypothetical protein
MKASVHTSLIGVKAKRGTKNNNKSAAEKCTKDSPDYGRRIVQALRQISQCMDINSRYLHVYAQTTMPQLACLEELVIHGRLTISALAKKTICQQWRHCRNHRQVGRKKHGYTRTQRQ